MEPSLQFQYFNMSDPVVGGMVPENRSAPRHPMGYNRPRERETIYEGQAEFATQLIPPTQNGS